MTQTTANFINIGERTNVTGSARFKKMIMEDRFDRLQPPQSPIQSVDGI